MATKSVPVSLSIDAIKLLSQASPSSYTDAAALFVVVFLSAVYLLRGYTWDKPDPYRHIWFERPQAAHGAPGRTTSTRNIAQKLDELAKDIVVFWGSQSGTAEGFANRLTRELHQRFHLDTMAADLSDFDPDTIALIPRNKIILFILSTYGEGDPSDNASLFWEWATKLMDNSLSSLRYATLGLGNSNYRYYNQVADVIDGCLAKRGAERLLPLGKADDANGSTEEDFLAWKDELFSFLACNLQLKQYEARHEPVFLVVEDESLQPQDLHIGEPIHSAENLKRTSGNTPIIAVKIRESRELFTDSSRSCLHMELDFSDHPQITYKTGDHLAVWPTNLDDEVERLLRVLGLEARRDIPISISTLETAVKIRVPTPTTIEALFRYYLEICAPVSRDIAQSLIEFAPNEVARLFLSGASKDKIAFSEFVAATHVTIGRLLEMAISGQPDATWSALPLSYLIEVLPRMQPRYYSISSSSVISPRAPSITALVSSTALASNPTTSIPGLTTNYLLALSYSVAAYAEPKVHPAKLTYRLDGPGQLLDGGKLFVHIRRSKFKLPTLASCPLVLVAAGTGIAPFRAFLTERARLQSVGKEIGAMILFFGCRSPDEDYIYRTELDDMEKQLQGKLRIVMAFSRLGGNEKKKTYVQDRVCEMGSEVSKMVSDGASLYICGRASMAREVGKSVNEVVSKYKGWNEVEAKNWTENMKKNRKWQEDVWG